MARLEELISGVTVQGILPGQRVRVIAIEWYDEDALDLTYEDVTGDRDHELVYRSRESEIELVKQGCPWSFDGDGAMLRLVSEAYRIRLAHLFDPLLAVHTSLVEPLPHQITAVYREMLTRQPLRFLLADENDPGEQVRSLIYLEHAIQDARIDPNGKRRIISQRMQFVEILDWRF